MAGRFVLEEVAGTGGMGTVHRARDTLDGSVVAVKLLHGGSGTQGDERFARESRVLAELHHRDIVRWIAHGVEPSGHRYLAMEWLEGEGLQLYLKRCRPSLEETVLLVRRIARALGVAHERGIVHRDLKPNNVFLVGGKIDRPKLLDFGVATMLGDDELRTITGTVLGTPGYMSPEQARGHRDVDARSDVFSLGVLLHRCLAGKLPFEGKDALALLMRVVLEEPPRLRDLRPDLPRELDELVLRMLSKSPDDRPSDASAVARTLDELGELRGAPACAMPESIAITAGETRVLCVVLLRLTPSEEGATYDGDATTLVALPTGRDVAARKIAASFGGTLDALVEGTIVVTFSGSESLAEQAVRAARCALGLRDLVLDSPIALVAGRAELSTGLRLGDVIDRGVSLLERGEGGAIRLDDVTSSLLEARFAIGTDSHGLLLRGERVGGTAVRSLLGKPTPLVGRDRELQHLEALLRECIEEPVARAVLVTAPAGFGKSRLRYELLRRVERLDAPVTVWSSSGDPMSAGAPYAMISPALKRAAGILDGEPIAERQDKLRKRVAEHVDASDAPRVTEFLGELVGTPFEEQDSVQLRSARRDPILMGDQIRRAWEDFVRAECEANPVLFVLEDLHWGDLPSVRLLDATLRLLGDRPFMVLALARPEVASIFPRLWSERGVHEVRLGELTRRAAEKLIRQALGAVEPGVVARIVERAQGNAFYLEELIRAAAEGNDESLPGTVLGMVQARLEALDPDARRLLRAGAVFGHTFHRGGVAALLGGDERLDDWLRELVVRETLSESSASRLPGEREFAFRHALVRDAAYAMLIDEDRKLGHRLAAEWLEGIGETAAVALAEHWERAGNPERSSHFYQRAAHEALEASDFAATIERADRAIAHGARPEDRGVMRTLQTESHLWRGELEVAEERGLEAISLLPRSGAYWCRAAVQVVIASSRRGNRERTLAVSRELLETVAGSRPDGGKLVAALRATTQLFFTGNRELASEFQSRLERAAEALSGEDPAVAARLHQMRKAALSTTAGDLWERRRLAALAVESSRLAGDLRSVCMQQVSTGYADLTLGRNQAAVDALLVGLGRAEHLGLAIVVALAKQNLGLALQRLGRLEEARAFETEAVVAGAASGDRRMEGGSRAYLAAILLDLGELDGAEEQARDAVRLTEAQPPAHAHALGVLAQVLLQRGRHDEALRYARRARELLAQLGRADDGEATIYLMFAEALGAAGEAEAAKRAILEARELIEGMASRIPDGPIRQAFFADVPENARIMELARSAG